MFVYLSRSGQMAAGLAKKHPLRGPGIFLAVVTSSSSGLRLPCFVEQGRFEEKVLRGLVIVPGSEDLNQAFSLA